MEVVLTKKVDTLGERGSIVRVADGYGRNYLLPKGMAILATRNAKRHAESLQRAEERREQQRRDHASAERDKVHGRAVTVRARATGEGKLYGSVQAKEICEALRETHGLVLDPHQCQIAEPIRAIGEHVVQFLFYHDIAADVSLTVKAVEEPTPAPRVEPQPEPEEVIEVVKRAPKPKPIITSRVRED